MEKQTSKDGSIHITDEKINTITHLFASCLAILGAALLITQSIISGNVWKIVSLSIYSVSLVMLFVFSTLHHGVDANPKINEGLRTMDYIAIFFLIAGTATPIVLVLHRNIFGLTVLGVMWAIALFGVTLRAIHRKVPKYVTNTLYIALGWMPVVLLLDNPSLSSMATNILALGGIIYTLGFIIYVFEKPNILPGKFGFHELWHILVILGSLIQYIFIYKYVLH